jgi:ATP-dependent helicase/nuclease subunit B
VIAAGVTSAPAIARLLRTVADLPEGGVVLPDLDLALEDAVWTRWAQAGHRRTGRPPFARSDAATHRSITSSCCSTAWAWRAAGAAWQRRAGRGAAGGSRAISNLFLPPEASAVWVICRRSGALANVRRWKAASRGRGARHRPADARGARRTGTAWRW